MKIVDEKNDGWQCRLLLELVMVMVMVVKKHAILAIKAVTKRLVTALLTYWFAAIQIVITDY